jgi:acetyl-CoA C-acetyltransferase
MTLDPRTPVLVGVGQVTRRPDLSTPLTERAEPVDLMTEAVGAAAADCGPAGAGGHLLRRTGSLVTIQSFSWPYLNPGLLLADRFDMHPAEVATTSTGGNGPQQVVNRAALAIAGGDLDVAVITGAECIYTRMAAKRDPNRPVLTWTRQPAGTPAPVVLGTDRSPGTEVEEGVGLDRPIHVYPLFENALRAHAGRSLEAHQELLAGLWSRFSSVAATNPWAWSPTARDATELGTVDANNRMISFPYPKLLTANMQVDQGAALILCSVGAATAAGVPTDRWIFPLAGAEANDHWFLSHRADLHSSPALRIVGRHALGLAGCGIDDVAHIDLYSCFPSAVQIAATELGLPGRDPQRSLTVTGGLTFAGGPGNNYTTHAIATMAHTLREHPGSVGLTTGVGWYLTKHAVGLWSTTPPESGFRSACPQDEVDALPQRGPGSASDTDLTIETYTVVYARDGRAERGILSCLTPEGARRWANVTDNDTLELLTTQEGCGRSARLRGDGRVDVR